MTPTIAILGAGPTGVGAAWRLAARGGFNVRVFEAAPEIGGTAKSVTIAGVHCDLGSHRLHPSTEPDLLAAIRNALGDDLLVRPRHGRIRLLGRWIHFPLRPLDMIAHAPPRFLAGALRDAICSPFRSVKAETFAGVLEKGLGPEICSRFYFPYARKMWGLDPSQLSATQARRRVSAGSPTKLLRKVFGKLPGLRTPYAGKFFYPRGGFGRIVDGLAAQATNQGAKFSLSSPVQGIDLADDRVSVRTPSGSCEADWVISTIPIGLLASLVTPRAPSSALELTSKLNWRSLVLVYVVLPISQYTEFDAHYFPEEAIRVARLSEPKNYSDAVTPTSKTVLCAEIPCDFNDSTFTASDADLAKLVRDSLASAGLPSLPEIEEVHAVRVRHAYPIYTQATEEAFRGLDAWVGQVPRVTTVGRLGLMAHDNTHHALRMGSDIAMCLRPNGTFDHEAWKRCREAFKHHVVED